jgi:hypothetical protein
MDFMTSDQYTELVGYLGQKFDGIDRKFDGVDERFEEARLERTEIRRHATVLFEQSQANLQAVVEGLGLRIERLEETIGD